MLAALGRRLNPRDPQLVRQAASQMAAELFFAPLLAEMRKLPFGSKFASGGRTEAIFGEQLDARVADTVAAADPGGLTAQLMRYLQPAGSAPGPNGEQVR
jgi:hypothetical protein